MNPKKSCIILTCEHGGNKIPRHLRSEFAHARAVLQTHRGWDLGALSMARELNKSLKAPLIYSETSRLVIDLNRSLHHSKVFSQFTKSLDREIREAIVRDEYWPYRSKVESSLKKAVHNRNQSLHLSIHSFTPVLNGEVRNCEIGLLYDPASPLEKTFCRSLAGLLRELFPDIRVRLNYPYKGSDDGLTSHLRKALATLRYCGIEIEFNQLFLKKIKKTHQQARFAQSLSWIIERAWSEMTIEYF